MKKCILLLISGMLATSVGYAQEDLLSILESEAGEAQTEQVYATFKTTRIINGQSIETTPGGILNFIVAHRFGKLNDGVYQLFGLDQATMRMGLEYGISDRLQVLAGRSSFQKTYDAGIKLKTLIQRSGSRSFPFSLTLFSGMAINTLKWLDTDRENLFSSRLSYYHQALIARKFSNDLSLQISPTLVHRNLVETTASQNDVFALGFGGRYKLTNHLSVNAEYFYQLPGDNASRTTNSVSLGIDLETGGHVFQLHVTNSQGMVENYFVAETAGDVTKGDIYFGFNINRVFTVVKKKTQPE